MEHKVSLYADDLVLFVSKPTVSLPPAKTKTKTILSKWSPLSMSLVGRINSIKMCILPKPCGGLAFSNFRFYYWAANLWCLVFWSYFYGKFDCPDWVSVEQHVNNTYSAFAFLGSPLPLSSIKVSQNPVVQHTLRLWAQFRNFWGFHSFSLLSPITSNYLFKPASFDPGFRQWHRKGIVYFKDLFMNNTVASFQQLSEKFPLPKSDFFRYLQIRHFIVSQLPSLSTPPDNSTVDSNLSFDPLKKGLISNLYNIIMDLKCTPTDKLKTAWEEDLGFSLAENTWSHILKLVNTSSLCARDCLIQFKVVHRVHMSRVRLS